MPAQEAEAPQGLRAISYGGGRQSTALVVLAAQGVIDFPLAIFSNVGDRAENPETIRYVGQHVVPWLRDQANVELVQTRWIDRTGKERDLYDDLVNPDHRTIDIPVYMEGGAPGNRKCTTRYKIEVVGRELKKRGASAANPCTVAVGFSTDELRRLSSRRHEDWERPVYPLIDLGISTADCARIVADAGLPPAPKSSCWFCPFQRPAQWAEKRRDRPAQFARAVDLEDRINAKRETFGKDPVYLSGTKRRLVLLPEAGPSMFPEGPETCDDGYCWT